MSNLEDHVPRVWNPSVRPLVDEAWRCYNSGAVRASIAATWTAVTADLIEKIIQLAEEGDGDAQRFRTQVEEARAKGISPDGVRRMQSIETSLLEEARQFELIDSIGVRELDRIREDRHLCVHPSLRHLGEAYEPPTETARAHLKVALDTSLVHPPTQGRKVIDQFKSYVCDPLFSPSSAHLQATFFDHVRDATRRNIVDVAAKHALCELTIPPEYSVTAVAVASRMAHCLNAFAQRDRVLVRSTMERLAERFRKLDGETQIRALARLGDQDYFWDMVDQPLADRLDDLVKAPVPEPLPAARAAMLALVRDRSARDHLPSLETRFNELGTMHRAQVAAVHPAQYFTRHVKDLLADAPNFRSAEKIGQTVVIPHGPYYSVDELRAVLHAWSANDQCRIAGAMPELAVELFENTAHLGDERKPVFDEFIDSVRRLEPDDSLYDYVDLEAKMHAYR